MQIILGAPAVDELRGALAVRLRRRDDERAVAAVAARDPVVARTEGDRVRDIGEVGDAPAHGQLELARIEIAEYPPAEIKKAVVGAGAATKEQVQFMVMRLLRLKTPPQPSDASDGVAAALAHIMNPRLASISTT